MNWANGLRRWTMRSIHSTILGAALLGSANLASAQQTPGSVAAMKLPPQVYSHNLAFELPMKMAPEWRAKVSEFRLYTKTATTNWKLLETGPQSLERFNCKVPQDGEYWYTLVTVDLQGKATPADVTTEAPSQRVVVDTTAPVIQVQTTTNAEGDFCLRCTIEDANPDPTSLKAVCKTDTGDISLEPVPNQPGTFRIKGAEPMQFPVLVSAMDMARNVGSKEVNVRELIAATLTPTGSAVTPTPNTPPPVVPNKGLSDLALPNVSPSPLSQSTLPAPRVETSAQLPKDPPAKVNPPLKVETTDKKMDGPVAPGLPPRMELPNPPPLDLNLAGHSSGRTEPNINVPGQTTTPTPTPNVPTAPTTPAETAARGAIPYQLINATQASVDFRIDQVGPSGVGKVEIYMTPDKGQSWHRLGESANKRGPADVNLPGDGLYGIRIVITNGNGFGGRAPQRGEQAHCEIEVDTTSPFVQLRSADVVPSTGQVEIRWNANDRNFGATPINLFYRTRIDGPWQEVVRGIKNDGVYRWTFPRELSSQFFFKVEATDQAGNVSTDVTRQPIVIDMTEPRATVINVSGSAVVRPVANGN